jgi:hypothetical protein
MKNNKNLWKAMFALTCLFAVNINANSLPANDEKADVKSEAKKTSSSCPTDINCDGVTNQADLDLLTAKFHQYCTCPEDINGDGYVSTADLNLLLLKFGQSCN